MRPDIDFHYLPVNHSIVYIFFSKKLNRVTWASADTQTEAIKRLIAEDSRTWEISRSIVGALPTSALERALMLDETDRPYGAHANSR